MAGSDRYHHGDLPNELKRAAVEVLTEGGPAGFSLREVARRAGVSHAAPAHHFGDTSGLLTAVAVDGFRSLAYSYLEETLVAVRDEDNRDLDVAVAARLCWSLVQGLLDVHPMMDMKARRTGHTPVAVTTMAEDFARMLLRGVGAPVGVRPQVAS